MSDLITQLEEAKGNVHWLVDHPNGLVDMRGLIHWAGVIVRLRADIGRL